MSDKTDYTPVCGETDDDFFGSLTGYDELAIETKFGSSILELAGTQYLRALAFVHNYRQNGGVDNADAKKSAKQYSAGLTIRQCMQFFAPPSQKDDDGDDAAGAGDGEGEAEAAEAAEEQPAVPPTSVRTSA